MPSALVWWGREAACEPGRGSELRATGPPQDPGPDCSGGPTPLQALQLGFPASPPLTHAAASSAPVPNQSTQLAYTPEPSPHGPHPGLLSVSGPREGGIAQEWVFQIKGENDREVRAKMF